MKAEESTIQLNDEQIAAVTHGKGPFLIVAGAGTGKTTVVTERIKWLIGQKLAKPSEILALTFTEKAALEMEERVDVALPLGYTQTWISTFHSFCEQVLREEAIHIGLDPDFRILSEAETYLFVRRHLFDFDLKYFRPLGNPTKFISGLITHFSRLKDEDISPNKYLEYAKKYSPINTNYTRIDANGNLRKLAENSHKLANEEVEKTKELAGAYKVYEELKVKESVMDFADLISNTLKLFRKRPNILRKYQKQFKYILVDEFQDTNYTQNELAKLLAGDDQNITVVFDDDQCLPPTAAIQTARGTKKIKDIKVGEEVLTAVGKGYTSLSKVTKIFKRPKMARFLTMRTKSGKTLKVTDNHKMFCYVPNKTYGKKAKWHYVYLMHRQNLGWRLGTTNDLATRLRLERSADRIVGLAAFKTEEEARYFETFLSLRYTIPTSCFKERENTVIRGDLLNKLYQEFNTERSVQKLASDLKKDLEAHHVCLGAVTRGQSERVKINIDFCYRRYKSKWRDDFLINPKVLHQLRFETSNPKIISKLRETGFPLLKVKKCHALKKQSSDLSKLWETAQKLQKVTGGIIDQRFVAGSPSLVSKPAQIMPAGNLLPGHFLPVVQGKKVIYDEIIEIKESKRKQTVYDLEIERTHNFVADGVVVHNSIYRWRGAAVYNVLDFRKYYPKAKIVTLIKNYRSPQTLLDQAYQLIQHNNPDRLEFKEKVDKKLKSQSPITDYRKPITEIIWEEKVEDEAEKVAQEIKKLTSELETRELENKKTNSLIRQLTNPLNYRDFAILVRANNHAQPFVQTLARHGIPYQFLGPGQLYFQEEIKDLIAYLKVLYNFEDNVAMYRVLNIKYFDFNPRDIAAILNYARKNNLSLFETMEKLTSELEIRELENKKANPLIRQSTNSLINLKPETYRKAKKLIDIIYRHLGLVPKENTGQILYYFLKDTGILKRLSQVESPKEERRVQNISRFFDKIKAFEAQNPEAKLSDFVEYLDFVISQGESPLASQIDWLEADAVNILTVHSAKGLEFPVVFMVNLVDRRFPTMTRREQIPIPDELIKETLPEGDPHLQEERRLFYVGMTRAKDRLYFTGAKFYGENRRPKRLSPFVYEALGEELEPFMLKPEKEKMATLFEWGDQRIRELEIRELEKQEETKCSPIDFLSYSQINVFEICPLQYKFKYILRIPVPQSAAASFGNAMHNALRDFYKGLKEGTKLKLDDLIEFLGKHWSCEGYESKKHEKKRKRTGEEALSYYYKHYHDGKNLPILLEHPFKIRLKDLTVGGYIDRVDKLPNEKVEIIDYKTGKVYEKNQMDKDLQLTIYALAVAQPAVLGKNFDQQKLSFYFFESGEKKSSKRSQKQIEEAKKEILETAKKINESDFIPTSSLMCEYCEYKLLCPAYQGKV